MDNYIVSARKYRPTTFKSVVGQQTLSTTLKNAIKSNKLAHAYLFCGPRGVGKTTCARIFAKTINCLSLTSEGEACNKCESCVAFNEQRSYNIYELDAASNNSVDDIRSLIEQVRISPQIGKYKVYIIDEVHMLSSAAFNAFLKTLEEPPHHAIFILATTEKHKILPTILSRCQIYDFNRISISDIVDHLQHIASSEGVTVEMDALNVLAQKADGGMRDALSIFDQVVSFTQGNVTYKAVVDNLNMLDYEYYFKLTDAILSQSITESLLILNDILNKGFEGQNIISGFAVHLRDLLVSKDPSTADLFEVGASIKERYISTAKKCPSELLYSAIAIVNECDLNYRVSKNKRLLVELTFIRLCQLNADSNAFDEKKIIIEAFFPIKSNSNVNVSLPPSQISIQGGNKSQISPSQEDRRKKIERKTVKSNLGISISSFSKTNTTSLESKELDDISIPIKNESFTPIELLNQWKLYAESLTEEHHLKNTMLNCLPDLQFKNQFEVVVNNPVQEQRLVDNALAILSVLRDKLGNSSIQMKVRVTVENEKKLGFTALEKFNLMIEQNDTLKKLKDEFGLELM